jgi:hypothetical protein
MPFKSAKQRRLMYAAAAGKSTKVSKKAAKKFIAHSKGKPVSKGRKRTKKSPKSNTRRPRKRR